ncbi:hypothetical protein AS156_12425 [Bradyrhizobium macuxiense]|uniref:Uncharacterized protein n=2 Tax=Bradyrhizobium macuxiense TaxID=1755647 RepID=A0A109JLU4_9BRAD|nr:hypothetical protein AS156_12425 [Bradyrhizobium macuxiense]
MITGMIAAVAVMAAAPAMACGFTPCGYSAPVVTYGYGYGYSGCNPCGGYAGWGAAERLPDPDAIYPGAAQQYYYVNQGPTYTGPGDWAPRPYYREGYGRPYYGYRHYGHRAYHHYRPWYHRPHYGYGYGYAPRHAYAPYHYGHRVLRRYY